MRPFFPSSPLRSPRSRRSPGLVPTVSVVAGLLVSLGVTVPAPGGAAELLPLPITFRDVADDTGIAYRRTPSPRKAVADELKRQPVFTVSEDFGRSPLKPHGAPGVALLDFDRDGDLDVYVTNGPGTANSLYANQLAESGALFFVDVAAAAGVAAVEQDSQGVCFGDVDNDGDPDLYVLGNAGPNRLFENRGDGTFADVTAASGTAGGDRTATACSMGDVNGDGFLDIAVANAYGDWSNMLPYAGEPFRHNQANQLLLNTGGMTFVDASDASGFSRLAGLPEGTAMLTWALAVVDVDRDGDADILTADDQTVLGPARNGGQDVGFVRLYRNDGSGRFNDTTFEVGLDRFGAWMGLAFGDLDCNGTLDFFATNMGNWFANFVGSPFVPGDWSSRWFLGRPDGTFDDPGVGLLGATPFGWGASVFDFDNDADPDVLFHGGNDFMLVADSSNAGGLLQNDGCTAAFSRNLAALTTGADHDRRNVQGVAIGDVNGDGFDDVVSVSEFDVPAPTPLSPYPFAFASPFDADANFVPSFAPTANPDEWVWTGIEFALGTLAVELNSASNANGWLQVRTLGTRGLVPRGRVNRDGIGALVSVSPGFFGGGATSTRPVLGGASYASQDSLTLGFGLGPMALGVVEVQWPGGMRNRLYGAESGERILFPEIPCSFAGDWPSREVYADCVDRALQRLVGLGVLEGDGHDRFRASALRAFDEEQGD